MHRSFLALGVGIATALALPSVASASSACSYDPVSKRVTVFDGSGSNDLHVSHAGSSIGIADLVTGHEPLRTCGGATLTNTDRIFVLGNSLGGDDAYIISAMGPGATLEADGNSEIEVQVQQQNNIGTKLIIDGSQAGETIKAGGTNLVMLGPDDDVDINEFGTNGLALNVGQIELFGNGGNDFLSGRGGFPSSFPPQASITVQEFGGFGDDTLVDGNARDFLHGEDGNDTLFSVDGSPDLVNGATGLDSATYDVRDSVDSDVENRQLGSVGRLRLTPAVASASRARVAHVSLAWRHPVSWRRLRAIRFSVYRDTARIGSVTASPLSGRLRASGRLRLAGGSRLVHRGKTVTARLGLRLPGSIAPSRLRVDVEAVDREGHRQVEPGSGTIVLRG